MAGLPYNLAAYFQQGYNPGVNPNLNPGQLDTGSVFNPNWQAGDPGAQTIGNRAYEGAWGQQNDEQYALQQQNYNTAGNYYGGLMNQAYANLAQQPGYSDQELQGILQTQQFQQGMTTPQQYQAMMASGGQRQSILGNTNYTGQYLDPSINAMAGNVASNQTTAENSINNAASGIGGALATQQGLQNDIWKDPSLNPSSAYYQQMGNAVSGAQGGVNAAINKQNLSLNLPASQYLMSDQQVQGLENQAANSVQQMTQAQNSAYARAAAADGNTDPMALAALQQQNRAQGDEAAANAQLNANLAATGQQRTLAMNYAQANLGANQQYAGMASGAAMGLGQMGMTAAQQMEQSQVGAAQAEAGMQLNAANTDASNALGAYQWQGQAGIQNAQNFGNMYQNALQYGATAGTGALEASDAANSQRNMQLLANQQAMQQYQYGNTYGQNAAFSGLQSQGYGQAANARIAGQNNFNNWASGQYGNTNQNYMQAGQLRNQAAGTTFGGMNQSTQTGAAWGLGLNNSGFANNFMNSLGRAVGSGLGSGFGQG